MQILTQEKTVHQGKKEPRHWA